MKITIKQLKRLIKEQVDESGYSSIDNAKYFASGRIKNLVSKRFLSQQEQEELENYKTHYKDIVDLELEIKSLTSQIASLSAKVEELKGKRLTRKASVKKPY